MLDKAHVKYTAVKMALDVNAKIYSFIDTLKQANTNSDFNDPAFDKAIKVNSITEEYAYVKVHCEGCKFVKQSLVHRKKQSYDVLTVEKLDGSTVDYYFDITSFFGKF